MMKTNFLPCNRGGFIFAEDYLFRYYLQYRVKFLHISSTASQALTEYQHSGEVKRRVPPAEYMCSGFFLMNKLLRLTRALCIEQHEERIEGNRYMNMVFFQEEKKQVVGIKNAA